ncbi:MAG: hypothetical protein IAE82_05170 [Opitutaceae bacterium]|nr:hypothetical protein [Opitutaceae bacterium]
MRYQLFALVHGRPDAGQDHAPTRTVPAVVEFQAHAARKRVVAVVDAAHELSGDEVVCTASMLCSQLQRAFSQHGLMLSRPELVPAAG